MPETDQPDNLVDELAEEFARRWRAGERPTVQEYTAKYPQWADEIGNVFPAVLMMEQLKPRREDSPATDPSLVGPARLPERIGEYRIVREIGRGGMGIVYEAVQESLGRRVALKVLPSHRLANEKLRSRFHRESHAAAQLHHTNIVPVFGVGEHDGLCFYVMQLIAGKGLDQVIREASALEGEGETRRQGDRETTRQGDKETGRQGDKKTEERPVSGSVFLSPCLLVSPSSVRTVARVGVQVADALAYAHSQGVLHRDIKPSNLLLDNRGAVWVTDFGVAKLVAEANLTQSGDLVGTLKYMPPERFAGQSDARGDVYSLGITLYELLALRPAFPDTTPQHLIQLITDTGPPPLRESHPDLSPDLETILLKATARDPSHRYQTACELAEDLRRFLDDRPILARRASLVEQAWRWCRRNPALAGAMATVFLLMVAVTVVSVVASVRTAAANRETATANQEMKKALEAEQAQREHAETASTLGLEALNRMYDRFTPTRLVVTPQPASDDGEELPPQPVLPPEVVPLLEELLRTYEQIAQSSQEFPRLRATAAEANHRIGDIRQRLGRFEDATAAYRTAVALYTGLPADSAGEAGPIKLARSYNELGRALRSLQQREEARRMHALALQVLTDAPKTLADRPEHRFELARTYFTLGQQDMALSPGGFEQPPPRGFDRPPPRGFDQAPPRPPGERGHEPPFGPAGFRGKPPPPDRPRGSRPEPPSQRAIPLLEQLVREHPSVPEYRHLLACCYRDAPPQPPLPGPRPPKPSLDRAIELLRQLASEFPKVPDYRFDLCETLGQSQRPPRSENRNGAAKTRERLEEAVALSANLVAQYPNVPQYTAAHAQYHDRLGTLLYQAHNLGEAEKVHRKAVVFQAGLVKKYPQVVAYSFWLSLMEGSLARVLGARGELQGARTHLETAASRLEELHKNDPPLGSVCQALGMTYRDLAQVHTRSGETELAAKTLRKAEEFDRERGPGKPGPHERGEMRP